VEVQVLSSASLGDAQKRRIIRAAARDVDVCFGIARAASLAGFAHVFPPELYDYPADAIRADWVAALADPDAETYLAFEGDLPVGVVSVSDGTMQTLYVLPELWGMGVGSALHDAALERLRALGVREARLWTLVENGRARAFYERRGWRLTGRTRVVPFPPRPIDVEYARSTDP
jgi:GNAT superfamily N-acetyltransferase